MQECRYELQNHSNSVETFDDKLSVLSIVILRYYATNCTSPRPKMPPLHTDSPASLTFAIVRNLSSYDRVVMT